jgi:hypothetical protein
MRFFVGSTLKNRVDPSDEKLNRWIREFLRIFDLIRIAKERLTGSKQRVQPESG